MNTCSICGARRECQEITIEKGEGTALGLPDGMTFHYCGPCWKVLQNKQAAAALLQGQTTALLRALGYTNPEAAARRFHERLMALGKPVV